MSKSVDDRVVSMQFDNRNFENNVKTSLSTLDKLKQSLRLTEASKGLENVSSAAKKFDINPLGNGVEAVKMKFSALEVMAITALSNITNSAVNAGKRIVSAFTIDPVKSGFQEYETQINAVQTILANTSSKGTTLDDVNAALDELNTYADKTIYNFTEMTRNIGTFTAAGIELDTSVNAIQGIANLAAVSGSTSQQASTAMYQLSQALAAGTVKLMDWNSVVNAGMGGEIFQNALKKTSEELNTGAEAAIKANGSFRESLEKGWLTSEVLTETLKKFTTSGANEYVAEYCGISADAVQAALEAAEAQYGEAEAVDKAAEALAKKSGKNKDEIKSVLSMARTAEDAATKVKTFSQLFDTLKEAAQSGWTQSFEILIGDFEEAKELLTSLSDFFGDLINKASNARNRILEGALGSPLGQLAEKVSKFTTAASEAKETVSDLGSVVDDVINGKFGNGQARWDALTKAGYNWAEVQNEVNKKLGSSIRHVVDVTEAQKEQTGAVESLTDAKLKELGLTEEEIVQYRQLEESAKNAGKSVSEFLEEDTLTGRELLINSLKNIGMSLVTVFKSMGEAWHNIFGTSDEEKIQKIYGALNSLNNATTKLAEKFKEDGEEAEKIRKTFEGLFAALDLVRMVVGGGLSLAFKVLKEVLSYFNMDVLDLTSKIGENIVKFRDWVKSHDVLQKAIRKIIPYVAEAIEAMVKWIRTSEDLKKAKGFIGDFVRNSVSHIKDFIKSFKEVDDIPKYIIEGLKNGLTNGIPKIVNAAVSLAKSLYEAVCDFLGIHSPSKLFIAIGGFIIAGLFAGIQNGLPQVKEGAENIYSTLSGVFENVDWDKLFAGLMAAGTIGTLYKLATAINNVSKPLRGLGDLFESTSELIEGSTKNIQKVLKNTAGAIKSFSFSVKAKALRNIAISLGILVACVIALTYVDQEKLGSAVETIVYLAGVLAALSFAVSKMADSGMSISKEGVQIQGAVLGIMAVAGAILMMAIIVKMIGNMDPDAVKQGFLGLAGAMAMIAVFVLAIVGISKIPGSNEGINEFGGMMIKMAIAMGLTIIVMKFASKLKTSEILQASKFMAAFGIFTILLGVASRIAGDSPKQFAKMVSKMAYAMILMVYVMKLINKLRYDEIEKGKDFMKSFAIFTLAIAGISRIAGDNINQVGKCLLAISAAMLIMAGTIKILGGMKPEELAIGLICIGIFTVIINELIATISLCGNNAPKIAGTIMAIGVAIGILAGVAVLLGYIDPKNLAIGVLTVGSLSIIMGGLIAVAKDANGDCSKTILAMAAAIGVMAVSIGVLSFIKADKLAEAVLAIGILMGLFILMEKSAKDVDKALPAIAAMDVALALITYSLMKLSKLNAKSVITSAAAISVVMLSLTAAMVVLGKVEITKSTVAALGIMALAIGVIGGMLALLSKLPTGNAAISIALVSAAILALSGAMFILSKTEISKTTLITLGIMTAAIAILGTIISNLASLDTGAIKNIAAGIALLVVTLAAIAIAVNAMNGAVTGAAALVIVTLSLKLLIPVLIKLCKLKLVQVRNGLIALAGAFAILGVAGLVLGPLTPMLIALGIAVTTISIGILLAATGMSLFATSLAMLGQNGSAGLQVLNEAIIYFIQLIPMMLIKVGEGLVSLIVFIGQAAPQIATAIINVVSSVITLAAVIIPQIVTFIVTIIESVLVTIAEHTPTIVQAGFDILIGLLEGIRNNIGTVTTTAIDIILAFINALGEKLPDIIQTGIDFVFNLIEGLGQGIENNAARLREVMISFCNHLWNAFKNFFGIHSPSTKMAEAGKNMVLGLIKGIGNFVASAVAKIADLCAKLIAKIKEKLGDFKTKGTQMIIYLVNGISSKVSSIASTIKTGVSNAIKAVKDKINTFKETGKNIISGLVNGIKANAEKVIDALCGIVENAVDSVKEFLGIKSPSRLFMSIGKYTDEGFAIGLTKYAKKVSDASESVGEEAVAGIGDALSQINDMDYSDDTLTPTITPVVDLDDVPTDPIQIGANVESILTRPVDSMQSLITEAQESINASNNKVIEAIKGLREDLNALYSSDDKELSLYIDGKKMASTLVDPMNRQLSRIAVRQGGL